MRGGYRIHEDRAGQGIAAEQRPLRAAQDLDAGDIDHVVDQ